MFNDCVFLTSKTVCNYLTKYVEFLILSQQAMTVKVMFKPMQYI